MSVSPTLAGILENALPEAIGGASVALILMLFERLRDSVRDERERRSVVFAVQVELRRLAQQAEHNMNSELEPEIISSSYLCSLIQIGMKELGNPKFEAALSDFRKCVSSNNAIATRLLNEMSGSSRAMEDHDAILTGLKSILASNSRDVLSLCESIGQILKDR